MTWRTPATGMASSAPRNPNSSTSMRMLTSTVARTAERCAHDDRLQDVVLQLLVHHEHHQDHDGGGQGVQGGHGDGHHGAQGRPDQGDQVGEANEQGDDLR